MKPLIPILSAALLVGCESKPQEQARDAREPFYQPGSAALVYTPPVAIGEEELDLSRDSRGGYALGGVETTIVDTTYVYQDDRQRYDKWGDWSRFERRAVSTSVTVRQR